MKLALIEKAPPMHLSFIQIILAEQMKLKYFQILRLCGRKRRLTSKHTELFKTYLHSLLLTPVF
jgi:hypothetical protein